MKTRHIAVVLATMGAIHLAAGITLAEDMKLPMIHGEIEKIDESAGKMTIKHGAITNLDMGAMTMVFKVNDPAMLKSVKAGDKVMFSADKVNGQLTVRSLEKAK